MKLIFPLLLLTLFLQDASPQETASLVVHEWGTFTSLQDEAGHAIGGINTDDEPIPDFVHTLQHNLLLWPTDLPPSFIQKGYPELHPDVTLRLETPVMYFYPAEGSTAPVELDVKASFKGGWLTEYYPGAQVEAPGLTQQRANGGSVLGGISEHTVGTLTWKGLRIGVDAAGPQTEEKVWLTPRQVRAASVATPAGESEKYLFYRGVGHLESLLRVQRSADENELEIRPQPALGVESTAGLAIRNAWLAHIRQDGSTAFRRIGSLAPNIATAEVLARVPARFAEDEFASQNLALLRAEMRQGLIEEGLFADEADAMLGTWEAAYFHSPGLRLFFTVPQAWTDHFLPLEFSVPVALTRVMVGRIEIVTPEQRALLAQIASSPVVTFPGAAVQKALDSRAGNETYRLLLKGKMTVADLGVPLPESFLAYLELGRMRNALLLNELVVRPTALLKQFVDTYRLAGYQVPEVKPADSAPPAAPPSSSTAVLEEQGATLPTAFALAPNYPNPFNSETVIRFALPQAAIVDLGVYNLTGQEVAHLARGQREAGTYILYWDGRDDSGNALATGVYVCRLWTESRMVSRKLLLLR